MALSADEKRPRRSIGRPFGAVFAFAAFGMISLAASQAAEPSYAGSAACADCHPSQSAAWSQSDHAWALRKPAPGNVLGDFSGATFTHKGVTSRFFQANGAYFIETDGVDGAPATYAVRYTVGVRPLQQYLVETEKGRLQVLDLAWDDASKRWFHLYPDQDSAAGSAMHWTGPYKNWQARCAECHQTGFDKGYDLQTRSYRTHWAELTVSCESCHGSGSDHVASARAGRPTPLISLGAGQQANEIAVCGPCHARRDAFGATSPPVGAPFDDHYNLARLTGDLYFADGQQKAEVFILGSFLQSKMSAMGVTCSNCHEPHSGKLVAEGNAVCTQCHAPITRADFPSLSPKLYDSPAHHHHPAGSPGAACVSCHMPERTYMAIDKRRDHFFRRPDPLQSKAAGSPDACTACHTGKTQDWAAATIAAWFPDADYAWQDRAPFVAFNGSDRSASVVTALAAYARDLDRPAIVRATAAELLASGPDAIADADIAALLADPSEFVRAAAVLLTRGKDDAAKIALLRPSLFDPSRLVRQSAAPDLAGAEASGLSEPDRAALKRALSEYIASRAARADAPESHVALGGLALTLRRWPAAEAAFRQAVALDSQIEEAWIMLARLRSALGDEPGAATVLDEGYRALPRAAGLILTRGDLEARRSDDRAAITWYERAIAVDGANADAWFALASSALRIGDSARALEASGKVIALQPGNADAFVIAAAAHFLKGDIQSATATAAEARRLSPSVEMPAELSRLLH